MGGNDFTYESYKKPYIVLLLGVKWRLFAISEINFTSALIGSLHERDGGFDREMNGPYTAALEQNRRSPLRPTKM